MPAIAMMHDAYSEPALDESSLQIGDPLGTIDETAFVPDAASPSLGSTQSQGRPAFELKFVLDEQKAAEVERHFSSWLTLDPHGEAALDQSYRITSLYTDTNHFDVFHRRDGYQTRKYRVRRYGDELKLYLERKTKHGRQVSKHRVSIPHGELAHLQQASSLASWSGDIFLNEVTQQGLAPVCRISYLRRAYFACSNEGRLRLTFDRELRGQVAAQWSFDGDQPSVAFALGHVICEFKFQETLPGSFKRAIEQFQLVPAGFSKYRGCVEAFGLATGEPRRHA